MFTSRKKEQASELVVVAVEGVMTVGKRVLVDVMVVVGVMVVPRPRQSLGSSVNTR